MSSILALEASTENLSVAIKHHQVIHTLENIGELKHSATILAKIDAVIKYHQINLQDLDTIAFGTGPGYFTGTRIAASIAQSLSVGLSIPIIAISSLKALAHQAKELTNAEYIAVALDARKQEVYFAIFNNKIDLTYAMQPQLLSTQLISAHIQRYDSIAVTGRGFDYCPSDQLSLPYARLNINYPSASAIAELAAQEYAVSNFIPLHNATPIYLRTI